MQMIMFMDGPDICMCVSARTMIYVDRNTHIHKKNSANQWKHQVELEQIAKSCGTADDGGRGGEGSSDGGGGRKYLVIRRM